MAEVKVWKGGSGALSLINDWDTLGSALQVRPKILAYALTHREELAHRIRLKKGRTVFKSAPSLQFVQLRIAMLAAQLVEELPEKGCILAYRKGIRPVEEIAKLSGCHTLITADVRHFFPSIRLSHITSALEKCGMQRSGARLVGRYCIAKYEEEVRCRAVEEGEKPEEAVLVLGNGKRVKAADIGASIVTEDGRAARAVVRRHGLQQGSPASSAISNLVGYYYIDEKILAYLRGLGVYDNGDVTYIRYCDNISLFCRRDMGPDFYREFRAFLTEEMTKSGFALHSWSCIRNNARNRNQSFLGVVLNHDARMERDQIDSLRALFINTCRTGFTAQYVRFLERHGGETPVRATRFVLDDPGSSCTRMHSILKGKVAYVSSVNKKHGEWLKKLYSAALRLEKYVADSEKYSIKVRRQQLVGSKEMFSLVKLYKNKESLENYMARIEGFLAAEG